MRTTRPPGRWPLGLLGMIGLVVAVESSLLRRPADFSEAASSSLRLSAEESATTARDREILCFGDSLLKHGFLPRVVEAETGRPSYNLCSAATQSPATYFLLRRALAAGARPRAIVVDFKPNLLGGPPQVNLRPWQELLNLREWLDLCRAIHKPAFAIEVGLGRLLPSYRSRFEVREALHAALKGEPPRRREENRLCWRQWSVNLGANFCGKNPGFDGVVGDDLQRLYHSHAWGCHRINAVYVRRFLDLAASRNIPVFWVLPPISPAVQSARDHSGADAGHTKFVRSTASKYRNVTVVDARRAGYDHTVFVDPTHLDGDGALALSYELAALISAPPAGGWVDLPPYRPRRAPWKIENVEESRVVVRHLDEARRAF